MLQKTKVLQLRNSGSLKSDNAGKSLSPEALLGQFSKKKKKKKRKKTKQKNPY